jgi:hypothetical protein
MLEVNRQFRVVVFIMNQENENRRQDLYRLLGELEHLKDKDEVNERDVCECDVCD